MIKDAEKDPTVSEEASPATQVKQRRLGGVVTGALLVGTALAFVIYIIITVVASYYSS